MILFSEMKSRFVILSKGNNTMTFMNNEMNGILVAVKWLLIAWIGYGYYLKVCLANGHPFKPNLNPTKTFHLT